MREEIGALTGMNKKLRSTTGGWTLSRWRQSWNPKGMVERSDEEKSVAVCFSVTTDKRNTAAHIASDAALLG